MDIIIFLFLVLISVFVGICLTLAVQWYLFNIYIMNQPFIGPENKPVCEPFILPKNFQDQVSQGKSAGAINALLQFLFQECRNTKRVRRWLRQRLTLELEELLTRTTTGKLFEKIILRDLQLGSHLPAIQSIEVKALNYDSSTKLLDDVELCLDLDYTGGFQLSIDASMRLSKTAHVSVKVTELKGLARLKFTRVPYTHWSFSFYDDPLLQLTVESQFQGRSLPQINNIIAHQIRKAVKRKHTLPMYQIRYKPFFVKPEPELSEVEPCPGKLEITLFEATRLNDAGAGKHVFCKLALDNTAWIEMIHSATASYLAVDVTLSKQDTQNLPPIFKQEFIPDKYQVGITIENITPSCSTELKNGDIVVMVNGKEVSSVTVLNKILRSSANKFIFRVERKIKNILLNDDKLQNCDQSILRHRRGSGEKSDSDSSNPPSSSDSPVKRSLKGSPEHMINRSSLASETDLDFSRPQMQSSKDIPFAKVITYNETFKFHVLPEHRYLNLSLWSRGDEKNILLGHISIPIAPHCSPEIVGNRVHTFSLLPPNPNMANSWSEKLGGLNGFEPCFCYGDVLVSVCFTGSGSTMPTPVATVTVTPPPDSTPPTPSSALPSILATHDFIRTHFPKVTQCDFCFKKIWLKDAFQCQGCLMTCHKKCAPKCQTSQPCARTKSQPEIVTTAPDNSSPMHILHDGNDGFDGENDIVEDVERESKSVNDSKAVSNEGGIVAKGNMNDSGSFGPKGSIGALLASMAGGIKRTGSVSTLAPPHHGEHGSTSLPPSPNHSPSPSRKLPGLLMTKMHTRFRFLKKNASLVEGCLFGPVDCGTAEVDQAVNLILSKPHDDNVMDIAKSSGKLLFADLPSELRKTRIDQVMDRLKDAMDLENKNHQTLLKDDQNDETTLDLVAKSEERLQALTILMLHCCAGLQDSQENSNPL